MFSTSGTSFRRVESRRPIIDLDKPEDYRFLLKGEQIWRGVVHAWTLDAAFDEANALLI